MNECIGLTVVCVCVCVCVCGWVVRSTCLQVEQSTFLGQGTLRIAISLQIGRQIVSLEEEHVDGCGDV